MATSNRRRLAIALSIVTAGAALAAPAGAQMFNARAAFDQRPRAEQVQWREFFPFPYFGGRGTYNPDNPFAPPRPQTFESTRPPPPRKVETPPTETVLVIGDSLADWLGYGLEETFADTPDIGIVRKIKPYAGLVRYEARNDAPDWSQAVKDVLAAEKPSAIVVMLGINDRLPLRDRAPPAKGAAAPAQGQGTPAQGQGTPAQGQGATAPAASPADTARPDGEQRAVAANEPQRRAGSYYEFHTDKWAELYDKRIDDMIAALKGKGVPVLWVGLPAIRGTRSTSDMSYLDELYRARAEKVGITYVDIWDGFVDEAGRYAVRGPDFEGQIRRLRTGDGVHFTKAGAVKLAHYVEHDLRRVLSSHVVPVALPGPEEQAPKGSAVGARPAIGPVVPLAAIGGGEGGDLLGAPSHPVPATSDPLATRVLSRGDAIAVPPGRADDFSWPRAGANAEPDAAAGPIVPTLPAPPAKGSGGKNDSSKSDVNKNNTNKIDAKKSGDAKAQLAVPPAGAATAPAKPRRAREDLDGAPRPPMPIAPSRD
jgi:hypothetical protein